jgi:hypothetical protein
MDEPDFAEWLSKMSTPQPLVLAAGPLTVHKVGYEIQVPHELLIDSGGHVCDDTCPPPEPDLPPLPWRTRVRYRARRVWWAVKRVPGLRLVHKDRVDRDDD